MKGIVLSTVAYMILAIVAITLLITLIGIRISPALRKAYCSAFQGVTSILPLPEYMKPPLPQYCVSDNNVVIETIELKTNIPEKIAFEIASHVAACWQKTGIANFGRDQLCYEIVISGVNGQVTEDDVKTLLEKEGYKNILSWKAGLISGPKSIAINYDADTKLIEVI